jgi:hypothetical protein
MVFAALVFLAGAGCSGDVFHKYEVNRSDNVNPYIPSTEPPYVVSAVATAKDKLVVTFNEELDQATAEAPTNYFVQGNNRVTVLDAPAPVLGGDNKTVTLSLTTGITYGMHTGKEYTLLVQRVKDTDNNAILNQFATFLGRGNIEAEIWKDTEKLPQVSPYPSYNTGDIDFTVKISGASSGSYFYSVNGGDFGSEYDISTPLSLSGLADGYYTLKVVGKNGDTGEWQEINQATETMFIVDTAPPVATLTHTPPTVTTSGDIAVMVKGDGVVTYSYKINYDAWVTDVPAGNAIVAEDLSDGEYTLYVRAKDAAGNEQATDTTCSWTVSSSTPVAVLSNTPSRYTRLRNATVIVGGTDVFYYRYQLNGSAWSEHQSTMNKIELSNLADGDYTLTVIGAQRAGDPSSEGFPVTYAWTVDNVAPEAILPVQYCPTNPTNSQKTNIIVSSVAGDVVSYKYQLITNGVPGEFSVARPVSALIELSSLPENTYTVKVIGIDAAGNSQPEASAAEWTWMIDLTPPRATLSDLPGLYTAVNDISITVGPGGAAAYKYLLDDATWSTEQPMNQKVSRTDLVDGYHTLSVIVRDAAGNWQSIQDPTEHVWQVDTVPPVAQLSDTPPSYTNAQNADIAVGGVGVSKYRYRLRYNSGTWTEFSQEYERVMYPRIQLPQASLPAPFNATLIEGAYQIEVQAIDRANNYQPIGSLTSHSWTVNLSLPTAQLSGTPPLVTVNKNISITVTNVDSYIYKIDNDSWSAEIVAAGNPIVKTNLSEGAHVLLVVGKKDGMWQMSDDDHVTKFQWTTDYTPPQASLSNRPPLVTSSQSADFIVGGIGVHSYKYSLDNSDPRGGTEILLETDDTINLVNIPSGVHTLYVIAKDEAGNWQDWEEPTTHTWQIDASTPDQVTAVFNPASLPVANGGITNTSVIGILVGGVNITHYKYRINLNSSGWTEWSTGEISIGYPISRSALPEGTHQLQAIGRNAAGTWQSDVLPTNYTWTIDTTPPNASSITLDNLPNNPTRNTSIAVTVGGAGITHYRYKINESAWSADRSVTDALEKIISVSGLTDQVYTLYVVARDTAGNWIPNTAPKSYSWEVNTTNPIASISNLPDNPTNQKGASIDVGGLDITHYKYNLDNTGWSIDWIDIDDNIILAGLGEKSHTIEVIGTKNLAEPDNDFFTQKKEDATTYSWTTDYTPPTVVLDKLPVTGTTERSIAITVKGTDVVAYRYKLNGEAEWKPVASEIVVDFPLTMSNLPVQENTIAVIGRDAAGNWTDATPKTHTWTIVPPPLVSPKAYDTGDSSTAATLMFTWLRPEGTADVKILIASDSGFAKIVNPATGEENGNINGVAIGNVDNYTLQVKSKEVNEYYVKVSVNAATGKDLSDSSWKAWGVPSDGISIIGGINGRVKNAAGFEYISGATIKAFDRITSDEIASTTTDVNGDFLLVNIPIGTDRWRLEVKHDDYLPAGKDNISVARGEDTDVGLLYLVPKTAVPGTITGKTVDANTGFVLGSTTVKVYDWQGNQMPKGSPKEYISSSDYGVFLTDTFDPGVYKVVFSKNEYYDLPISGVVVNGNRVMGRQALCELLIEPQVRFVYQWDSHPSDPDIFLTGPTSKDASAWGLPANRFYIRSALKNYNEATGVQWGGITDNGDWYGTSSTASLVQDSVTGYGPEAINLYRYGGVQYAKGMYTFTVHRYAYNRERMNSNSGAFEIENVVLTAGSATITGAVSDSRDTTIACTVTSGSTVISPNDDYGDGTFYYRYGFRVTGTGIPANAYMIWYDRSKSNKPFQIDKPATASGGSVNVTLTNMIESYGIYPGMIVTGTGIPADTFVQSVTNTGGRNFSMVLSNQITTGGTRTLTFYPGWGSSSGLVRIYDSGGMAREIIFPAKYLGSDDNCWKVLKLDVQGPSRSKRTPIQINQMMLDTVRNKASMDW